MRIQSGSLTLFTVLLSATASAHSLQPNALQAKQVTDLSRTPTRNRVLAAFQAGAHTHRVNGTSNPFANGRFIPNGFHKGASPAPMKLSPQSQLFVIDTAIVRNLEWSSVFPPSPADTTRHVYSFNAGVQRTSDLIQKLRADLWVDTLRQTNTYDANGNNLSELCDSWSSGQWVNRERYAYTCDDQGNVTSLWHYSWLDSFWTPSNITSIFRGYGFTGTATDSAGNYYDFGLGYSFTFAHKLLPTRDPEGV